MGSTFGGLEVGKRALFTQRTAMTVTGHNIANANTVGYTRQQAVMKATQAYPVPGTNHDRTPGQVGTGVEVTTINRLRENYLDKQYRMENSNHGYWEGKANTLEMVENIFGEPSDTGLQSVMDQFWQSWQDLSNETESISAREIVVQRAHAVSETMNQLSTSLTELKRDMTAILDSKIQEVNSLAGQIQRLNEQINKTVPYGYTPNDLYDQRDVLVDQLSKLVSIKEVPSQNGMINIEIEGGQGESFFLVNGKEAPAAFTAAVPVRSGGIAAIHESIGTEQNPGVIDRYLAYLNTLATEMASEINGIHQSGVNLEDIQNNTEYSAGQRLPFFVSKNGGEPQSAADLVINPDILMNVKKIAASKQGIGEQGDGSNALELAKLKFKTLQGLDNASTLDQYYRFSISKLGMESQESQRFMTNADAAKEAVETRRQSVSGVSLDEEMTNMVKFQQAYNAASRMISTVDEMLDKLINGTGRVGL